MCRKRTTITRIECSGIGKFLQIQSLIKVSIIIINHYLNTYCLRLYLFHLQFGTAQDHNILKGYYKIILKVYLQN